MTDRPSTPLLLAAYGAIYFIWGSTYLAIRFTVETLPPFLSGGLRFLAAGLALLLWSRFRTDGKPTPVGWRNATMLAFVMILMGYGGVMWAQQVVPSGIAALILSVEPLWFFVLDWLIFRSARPRFREWVGLLLGFAGTLYLAFGQGAVSFEAVPGYRLGTLVIFLSSLGWVFGSLLSRTIRISEVPLLGTAMEMTAGGVLLTAVSVLFGEWSAFSPSAVSLRSWLALGYLVTFGSLVAFTAFVWLLRVEPASRVATHGFVNPVVAVLLGWAFAGEALTLPMLVAGGVVVLSVTLITFSRTSESA